MDVETQQDQAKPRRSVSSTIALVIALLALVLASIAVMNIGQEFLRSRQTAKQDQPDFSGIPAEIKQLQAQLDQLQDQQTQMQQTLTTTTKDLSAILLEDRKRTWQLDEMAHLLRLAQYQLQFSHNPMRALELLSMVSQDSNKLKDPTLSSWQQALQQELDRVKAMPKVNANQLLSQLEILKTQISSLPLKNAASRIAASTAQQQNAKSNWRQALNQSWDNIKNLIVVRRTDEPIQPLLAPGQRVFLEQNLRLSLQQAEWGVIGTNAVLYRQGIKQVAEDIKLYFDGSSASTKNFLQTLQQLSGIDVEPPVPDLAPLITQLQQVLANRSADKSQSK